MIRFWYWATPYIIFLLTAGTVISLGVIPIYYAVPVIAVHIVWFISTRKMLDRGWIRR
jgi:hypothetical protein